MSEATFESNCVIASQTRQVHGTLGTGNGAAGRRSMLEKHRFAG
jgi:hypothetical protein